MLKKLLIAFTVLQTLLFLPPAAGAQGHVRLVVENYDLDSTTFTYCIATEVPLSGLGRIETSGSSATVTAVDSTATPFARVEIGDIIYVTNLAGNQDTRFVTAKASSISLTVNAVVDWDITGGYAFTWREVNCGTADTDGWFPVDQFVVDPPYAVTMVAQVDQINVTGGINFRWECAAGVEKPVRVCPATGSTNITLATIDGRTACIIDFPFDRCRIGMAIGSADDGGDLTTNMEQIKMYVIGGR